MCRMAVVTLTVITVVKIFKCTIKGAYSEVVFHPVHFVYCVYVVGNGRVSKVQKYKRITITRSEIMVVPQVPHVIRRTIGNFMVQMEYLEMAWPLIAIYATYIAMEIL
jgi:hypothetical protein